MRYLFASAAPHPPEAYSGAECSIDELAVELRVRGHACTVVAGVHGRARRWLELARRVTSRGRPAPDASRGYPVYRAAPEHVVDLVAKEIAARRPDLVVTWNTCCRQVAYVARDLGIPVLVWVPDVEFGRYLDQLPPVTLAAASSYVARRLEARLPRGAPPVHVMRPVIRFDAYRAAARAPKHVTLVNPVRYKGLEVVLGVAALLPHRRFVLVDSWRVSRIARAKLRRRLVALPNVTLQAPVAALASVYARTALLLVPSQIEDAAPRVVLEAQVNGIPVVASEVGGISETLGAGGILCPPDAPHSSWAEAVESVLADPGRATELAALGHANVARAELGPARIVEEFLALAADAVRPEYNVCLI